MAKFVVPVLLLILAAGCSRNPSKQLADLSQEFVYTTLSFSPISATAVGLHVYRKQKLDDLLDDISPAGLHKQRRFYRDFQNRLLAIAPEKLSAEDAADHTILRDQCALALLD